MCESCDCVNINGMNCHEFGCPDKNKVAREKCPECGIPTIPENQESSYEACLCEKCLVIWENE